MHKYLVKYIDISEISIKFERNMVQIDKKMLTRFNQQHIKKKKTLCQI